MNITIRPAVPADLPALNRLLRQVLAVHHEGRPDVFKTGAKKYGDDEILAKLADPRQPVFVAADGAGEVAGYVFAEFVQHQNHPVLTNIKTLFIDDLCVDETRRGANIGRALYEHAAAFAREHGCHNLTLNVWACNGAAVRFYEKCGMKPQKIGMEMLL